MKRQAENGYSMKRLSSETHSPLENENEFQESGTHSRWRHRDVTESSQESGTPFRRHRDVTEPPLRYRGIAEIRC